MALLVSSMIRGGLLQNEKNTVEVFNESVKSVVNITNKQVIRSGFWPNLNTQEIPAGAGSGFVWDREGHLVTNYHVVASGDSFVVSFHKDKKQYEAKVVGVEPKKDVAVLKLLEMPEQLHPISIGSSKNLLVGQKALAIGNPFGLDHTITKGIISALGRKIEGIGRVKIHHMIQTDCSINPGNSGGPLLDSEGRLIGMNTAIYSRSGSSAGIGFAVPVDTIKRLIPPLIKHGKIERPSIGILLLDDRISEYIKNIYKLDKGVVIDTVLRNSPAAKGGLRGMARDHRGYSLGDVILEVAGKEVNSYNDIYHALDGKKSGDVVVIRYRRGGSVNQLSLKLK